MSSSPPTETDNGPAGRPPIAQTQSWRDPRGWSLRTRLVAVMIALLAVLGLVVGVTTQIFLHNTLYNRLDAQLLDVADRSGPGPGPGPGGGMRGLVPPGAAENWIVLRVLSTSDGPVAIGQGNGLVVFQQADSQYASRFEFQPLPAETVAEFGALTPTGEITDIDLGGDLGEYRAVAILNQNGLVSIAAVPLAETQETLLAALLVTGGCVLFALVVAGWAGATIVRRSLRPLERVAATATRVSELELDRGEVDLAQRVPAADTDVRTEVGQVGAALNRMLDHVGQALEARHASETQVRQFVADASHELRTPLAAIRGYAELSRRSRQPVPDEVAHVLRRVESEAKRMTTLVEDLLLLARLDAGRPLGQDRVDLSMLVVDTVSDAHATGPGHDWQLDLPEEPVQVTGDQARLHQVLANLLANARTHTPEGTTVTIGVTSTERDAVLRVVDAGPGIPTELQPHIFERFARGDSSRSRAAGSTGLGLSIVDAVVSAHGGKVSVESVPGRTEFTVRLPLALPESASPSGTNTVHQHVAQVVQ